MKIHRVLRPHQDAFDVYVNDRWALAINGLLEHNMQSMAPAEKVQAVRDANRGAAWLTDGQIEKILTHHD